MAILMSYTKFSLMSILYFINKKLSLWKSELIFGKLLGGDCSFVIWIVTTFIAQPFFACFKIIYIFYSVLYNICQEKLRK